MRDPLLGTLTYDDGLEQYVSARKKLRCFGGHACSFGFADYEGDPRPDELRAAVQRLLDAGPMLLKKATRYVAAYCEDMLSLYPEGERPAVKLARPADVWPHVKFGRELTVQRRARGDAEDGIYLSLECNCDWEVEHGLQLVIRDGREVTKVGPFNGHMTHSDAYADRKLAGLVYKPIGQHKRR